MQPEYQVQNPERRGLRKGVYLIPSVFTAANIGMGFYAVMAAVRGFQFIGGGEQDLVHASTYLDNAAKAIGWAVLFDMLDGRIARMTKTTTEIGVQLDSIADVVTFGLAPAVLAYVWGFGASLKEGSDLHQLAWFLSFMYLMCGAFRLARFNDLVFVNHLEEEAAAAMQASQKTNRPFVVRPAEWTNTPARFFQRTAKQILTRAAAITADGPALCAALTASGCARESIFDIPDGVPPAKLRSEATRLAARAELGEADHALLLDDAAPLALYAGPLAADRGLNRLLEAWRIVIDQDPTARLWMVGEGPERERLARQIQTAALSGRVSLVSPFDTMESFYQAADLFVQPGNPPHVPFSLREAMAAGLPCVVSDAQTSRLVVEPGCHGMLAEGQTAGSLAKAILNLLSNRPLAEQFGNSARDRASETFALAKVAQQHVELWERIKNRSTNDE